MVDEFTVGPRIVAFRCPRECGIITWHAAMPGNHGLPGVSLLAFDAALAEWNARAPDCWPAGWAGVLDHPACPRCGAKPDERQEHGSYVVEGVGGVGKPWKVTR